MKRMIVTADDFGLSIEVNEAVELAHTRGILTAASLMVGAPACADAVARARRLPRLRVGLHLALVDADPENFGKFKDVLDYLKQDLHHGDSASAD